MCGRSPVSSRVAAAAITCPSLNDSLRTPPPPLKAAWHDHSSATGLLTTLHQESPRGLLTTLHRASPMERESRRILSVELRDIANEVELQVQTPPCERTSRSRKRSQYNKPSSMNVSLDLGVIQSPAVLPLPAKDLSQTFPACSAQKPSPLSAPKEEPGWGLVPLFNSVRSKLESFAEIFLTPVKSHRESQTFENGACPSEPDQQEGSVLGDVSRRLSQEQPGRGSEDSGPGDISSTLLHWDGSAEDNPSPSQLPPTPPNNKLQTCLSPSVLCRPPLQRQLSCPILPHSQHKWRHSLDSTEYSTEPCTCRRRRHSLGSVEECRSLPLMPFTLSCLRKEIHPSVLKQLPYQPDDVQRSPNGFILSEGSPTSLDKDREQGLSASEDQVTKESLPDSDFKTPENLSRCKQNKVSNIQIRKRSLRQQGNLTPLGLPKRVRLQKEDFSLEEIYTNKNYHTPTEKRKFETIFEEPIMKGGTLILTSQRSLRRIMVFKDGGSAQRKRKRKGKAAGRTRRYTGTSAEENVNYELLLQRKLKQLEAALQEDAPDP
ncbi:proline-rich protein 14 isoform X2 [Dendropsophus ebraccatus]|uniref:proline-rich protein 14 isoform X2 n=1 Tax=Dendropsophus ebraccatus TaxID=150705 RepID=UPI003831A219